MLDIQSITGKQHAENGENAKGDHTTGTVTSAERIRTERVSECETHTKRSSASFPPSSVACVLVCRVCVYLVTAMFVVVEWRDEMKNGRGRSLLCSSPLLFSAHFLIGQQHGSDDDNTQQHTRVTHTAQRGDRGRTTATARRWCSCMMEVPPLTHSPTLLTPRREATQRRCNSNLLDRTHVESASNALRSSPLLDSVRPLRIAARPTAADSLSIADSLRLPQIATSLALNLHSAHMVRQ